MPWHLWLQQQIFLGQIPNEQRGPPALHREMPNRNHMQLHADPSADTLSATQRMLGYLQSNFPWSTYLNTLPFIARRHSRISHRGLPHLNATERDPIPRPNSLREN